MFASLDEVCAAIAPVDASLFSAARPTWTT